MSEPERNSANGNTRQIAEQRSELATASPSKDPQVGDRMPLSGKLATLMRLRPVRFVLVGVFGALVELGTFSYFLTSGMSFVIANVLAFHVAFAMCFVLHSIYTYRCSFLATSLFLYGFIKYSALMYAQLSFGTVLLWVLIDKMNCVGEIAKILQIAIVTPIGYLIQKTMIFRSSVE